MAIIVEVAGVDRTVEWRRGTPTGWNDQLNGRGTGRIGFTDEVGGFFPDDGQTIEIIEDGTVRFGGILMEPTITEPGGDQSSQLFFSCQISDYNILADRRTVGETFENVDFDLIVSGIVTNWMAGEGISLAGVEADVALSVDFGNVPATVAFNALSDATGKFWSIDENKVLNFRDRDSIPAPADMDGDTLLAGTITVREDRQKYRNEQIVRAGTDEFPILVVSGDLTEQAARKAVEGTSGVYSEVSDEPQIINETIALEKAGDFLDRFGEIGKVVTGRTRTVGFRAGQEVNVHLPHFGVTNTPMLVDSVDAEVVSTSDGDEIWYMLRAITGDPFGGWMEHFRKLPPIMVPLTFANEPGLFRVDPTPGVVIHDPLPSINAWFQGPQTGPFASGGSAVAITHQKAGKGGFMFKLRRGGGSGTEGCGGGTFPGDLPSGPACFASRQSVIEGYPIAANESIATTPTIGTSWDELAASSFKSMIVIDPTNTMVAFVERHTAGGEPTFGIALVNNGGLLGSVEATGVIDNNTGPEGLWIGDYVYWPDSQAGGSIFVFNVTDPANPTLEDEFVTSATGTINSVAVSADGKSLYAIENGGLGRLIALDITDPSAITEDDALSLDATTYVSIDIDNNGSFSDPQIGMVRRVGSTQVAVTYVPVVAPTTFGTRTTDTLSLSTSLMDGWTAVYDTDTLIVVRSRVAFSPANSQRAHVFKIDPVDGASFVETLSYNHGGSGALPQARSVFGNRIVFDFTFGTDVEVTFAQVQFNEIVPLTIDNPLRAGFGGTGLGTYALGDLIYADRVLPDDARGHGALTRLPIEDFGDVLMVSGDLPVWQSFPETADFFGIGGGVASQDQLLFTTTDVVVVTSGALANVDDLEADVVSGETYYFRAELFFDADVAVGHRWAIGGTAAGDVIYQIRILNDGTGEYSIVESGQKTALGESAGEVGTTDGYTEISGSIEVIGDGTIVPQFGAF